MPRASEYTKIQQVQEQFYQMFPRAKKRCFYIKDTEQGKFVRLHNHVMMGVVKSRWKDQVSQRGLRFDYSALCIRGSQLLSTWVFWSTGASVFLIKLYHSKPKDIFNF